MCDVRVENEGSIIVFEAQNEDALRVMDETLATEGWQWMGRYRLCVDHRMAAGVAQVLLNEGLEVE